MNKCPLCLSDEARFFHLGFAREYHRCSRCYLVFVPEEYWAQIPQCHSTTHTNKNDILKLKKLGPEKYFMLLTNPVIKRVEEGGMGLDYGCGSESIVSKIFAKNGMMAKFYDKKHHPNEALLTDIYDFITVIHQIETYGNPREKFDLFDQMLSADEGVLAIMCNPLGDLSTFNTWPFKKGANHITYYHTETLKWIANKYHYSLEILSDGIVIFTQT